MFTVDTDRIQAAASDMSSIAGEIESSVGAMHARLTSLDGSWTGAAATEFQGLVSEWSALQGRVRADLAQIASLTSRASGTYQQTEEGVRGLFAH
jgi:6 kDa early secretory antigenic target